MSAARLVTRVARRIPDGTLRQRVPSLWVTGQRLGYYITVRRHTMDFAE